MLKFLLVVIIFAAAVYLTARAIQRRGVVAPRPQAPRRPMSPDDDVDFLRDLDRRSKRKRKHPEDPEPDADADAQG